MAQLKAQLLHPELLGDVARKQNTPAVGERARLKVGKYQPLIHIYQLLSILGATAKVPTFKPLIVSHNGEFGAAVFEFIDWFCPTVVRQAKEEFAYTGEHPKVAVRKFRNAALDALATVSAIGAALHGMAATLPSLFPARASGRWVYNSKPVVASARAVTWLPVPKHSVASLFPCARTCQEVAAPALSPVLVDLSPVYPGSSSTVPTAAPGGVSGQNNASAIGGVLGGAPGQKKVRAKGVGAVAAVAVGEVEIEVAAVVQSPPARRLRRLPDYTSPPLFKGGEYTLAREKRVSSKHPPSAGLTRMTQSASASVREGTGVGIVKGGKRGSEGTVVAARGRKEREGGGVG
jgi:hypothetical protein